MISVRERPPLRLEADIKTPSGARARWAADERDPGNQPQDLTFSTTIPGGFESLSLTLQRNPRLEYADLEQLADVTVRGLGGSTVAWQGRLEAIPDTGGSQSQISPAGSGYQNALQDNNSAAMIYIDQDLSTWGDMPLARQEQLLASGSFTTTGSSSVGTSAAGTPALTLEIDGAWTTPLPVAEAWYDAGLAGTVAKIYFLYTPGTGAQDGGVDWVDELALSPDELASSGVETSGSKNGTGTSGLFAPTTPQRFGIIQHYYNAAGGADGYPYYAYWRLAVLGPHGLPVQGTASFDTLGLLASDVCAHAVDKWASEIAYTTGSNGTIQPSSFVIPQLAFTTPTTVASIIQQAVQYELLDWAVWEGPTFWLNPLGESQKTRYWRSMVGAAQLQETGADVSRLFNGVVVQFTNVDGTTGTVGPPGSGAQTTDSTLLDSDPQNPANQAGITKYGILQMGTTTPAAAIQVGALYLNAQAQFNSSGQASLVGHVQDNRGVWWPAWAVRAGDYISFTDAADSGNRRIVSTSYDDSSKTNAIQLDQPPDTITALLQRMSVDIAYLGLS